MRAMDNSSEVEGVRSATEAATMIATSASGAVKAVRGVSIWGMLINELAAITSSY